MQTFEYTRANAVADSTKGKVIAGGTTLVDLMKLGVETPTTLVDITRLPLDQIEPLPSGGMKIGAMVRNSDLAAHPAIREHYAVLSQALLSGASPQLRNMATTGGNLMQRTRCPYFRDPSIAACNKRTPGSGCAAVDGHNRMMAVLGTSDKCVATHPSDMCVAMTALNAVLHLEGPAGARTLPIADFFTLPGETPNIEHDLKDGEIITHVELPPVAADTRSVYLKLRDRASYEFALASAAVVVQMRGGHIQRASIALGGVATKPWRAHQAEATLVGKAPSREHFRHAAEVALNGAKPLSENGFKIELARRCITRALVTATA